MAQKVKAFKGKGKTILVNTAKGNVLIWLTGIALGGKVVEILKDDLYIVELPNRDFTVTMHGKGTFNPLKNSDHFVQLLEKFKPELSVSYDKKIFTGMIENPDSEEDPLFYADGDSYQEATCRVVCLSVLGDTYDIPKLVYTTAVSEDI